MEEEVLEGHLGTYSTKIQNVCHPIKILVVDFHHTKRQAAACQPTRRQAVAYQPTRKQAVAYHHTG